MGVPPEELLVVYVTAPAETAPKLAADLVARRLVACVNLLAATSVYRWQGQVEQAQETLMMMKTRRSRFADLKEAVLELHPYDLPEIIGTPLSAALPAYAQWVADEVDA